jgi:hypothetical protein
MNPVMIQQVSRADRHDRARQLEEIRLLNQAYPGHSRSATQGLSAKKAHQSFLPSVARRLRAWIGGRQEQALAADNRS